MKCLYETSLPASLQQRLLEAKRGDGLRMTNFYRRRVPGSPHRAKALSREAMRGMARGYAAGDSRTGCGARLRHGTLGQLQAGRAGNGMACSRAKARLNWVSQGQRRGRCKVRRRAERVIRPGVSRGKTLGPPEGLGGRPRPMRARPAGQVMRHHWTARAPLAAKRPDLWFSPTPYLRSRMACGPRRGRDDRPPVPASPHRGR